MEVVFALARESRKWTRMTRRFDRVRSRDSWVPHFESNQPSSFACRSHPLAGEIELGVLRAFEVLGRAAVVKTGNFPPIEWP